MGLRLSFHHPHFPEGYKFALNDLGVIENGGSLEVSDEQAAQFAAARGKTVEEAFANSPETTVEGTSSDEAKKIAADAQAAASPVEEQKEEPQQITPTTNEPPTEDGDLSA